MVMKPAAGRSSLDRSKGDKFEKQKVTLGKKKCTCDFDIKMGTKCSGTAKCDKKCSGTGTVEIGGCSFKLAMKKGKGKISGCTCAAQPTEAPAPTGTGSGSGETPVPMPGSGSGSEPMPPTGGSGSGAPAPGAGEGMQCACKCTCPDGSGECDCDCNCPMTSKAVTCAEGFSKVCPMMEGQCPADMDVMCPNGAMSRMAGGNGGEGSDKGCVCVPDFLMAMVMKPAAGRSSLDRSKGDKFEKQKVTLGKKKCTCDFDIKMGTKCSGTAKCDKKCSGTGTVEIGGCSFKLAVKKGKGKISGCACANGGNGGAGSGSGSGNGGEGAGASRCACVSKGMGGTGPSPPTGSGSGPAPTGSGSGSEPAPPTGSGSGSGGPVELKLRNLPKSTYPLAVCNDGTQATYYTQGGGHSGKVMIWLQGGGACWDKGGCDERCGSGSQEEELCTSQTKQEITFWEGSAAYGDYWMVYVHYCSSDLWSGTNPASSSTGGYNFQGKNIVDSIIKDLSDNHNLLTATKVVLTGCSAGAAGVAFNCDDVAAKMPNADFRCVADAPDFFPPDTIIAPGCFARDPEFQNMGTQLWGRKYDQSCQDHAVTNNVDNVGELCGALARSIQFISTPFLLMTNYFDPAITIIHGCEQTYEAQGDTAFQNFKDRWINGMKAELDSIRTSKPEVALYVTNCVIHCMTYEWPNIKVEQQTIAGFISSWLAGDGKTAQHAVDGITSSNPTCPVE